MNAGHTVSGVLHLSYVRHHILAHLHFPLVQDLEKHVQVPVDVLFDLVEDRPQELGPYLGRLVLKYLV